MHSRKPPIIFETIIDRQRCKVDLKEVLDNNTITFQILFCVDGLLAPFGHHTENKSNLFFPPRLFPLQQQHKGADAWPKVFSDVIHIIAVYQIPYIFTTLGSPCSYAGSGWKPFTFFYLVCVDR